MILLTRFNCRFGAPWTSVALAPRWLGPRFQLFERYCLPSVLHQTCQEFKWVIFFDEDTPEPFRSQAQALASDNIYPTFVAPLTGTLVRQTIRQHVSTHASQVITSRLDNDDGLATDYVERVLDAVRPRRQREYLNVTEGLLIRRGRVYRRRDPHNAFVSLVEPNEEELQGVWTCPHTEIRQHAPVRQVGGGPGWLQVIHETNVSNKIRGRRVQPGDIDSRFVLDRDELIPAQGPEYLWERNVMWPCWALRDTAAAASRTGKRLLGKGWRLP